MIIEYKPVKSYEYQVKRNRLYISTVGSFFVEKETCYLKEMKMKRNISKRFELNRKEADLLRIKSRQTGLTEGDYIRELILNSQPVEAPPRQFYEAMGQVNKLVADVRHLTELISTSETPPPGYMDELWEIYQQMLNLLLEIKTAVTSARYYAASAYESWLHELEEARRKGKSPPEMGDYEPRDRSRDIMDPADPDIGWNALRISPPFLLESEEG